MIERYPTAALLKRALREDSRRWLKWKPASASAAHEIVSTVRRGTNAHMRLALPDAEPTRDRRDDPGRLALAFDYHAHLSTCLGR